MVKDSTDSPPHLPSRKTINVPSWVEYSTSVSFTRSDPRMSSRGSNTIPSAGRACAWLHRQRLDSDPSGVQPMFENNVNHETGHDGDGVIPSHRWRRGVRPLLTPPEGDAVCNRPGKKSSE